MDPVTAFTLAGTIFQLIEYSAKFVLQAWKLYRKETVDANYPAYLLSINEDLLTLLPRLSSFNDRALSGDRDNGSESDSSQKELQQLASDCKRTVERVLQLLQSLKLATNNRRRLGAIRAAFQMIIKEDELRQLDNKITAIRSQFMLNLLVSIRQLASRTTEQQGIILKKLNVDQRSQPRGASAPILQYMVSASNPPSEKITKTVTLQRELMQSFHKTRNSKTPNASREIYLSEAEASRAYSAFSAGLKYNDMRDRETRVAEAHKSTLRWALEDGAPTDANPAVLKWVNFRQWLESDDQLYWVTGKAGSGKSTFMKYMCSQQRGYSNDPHDLTSCRCYPYLAKWASGRDLVVASFYFWSSGIEIQMTLEGLLRTLVHQVAQQQPHIVPKIAPVVWEYLCLFDDYATEFDENELLAMLQKAVEALVRSAKICFFIDGLDEFCDDHNKLILLIKDLTENNPHVKFCVASRPWTIFEDALGRHASLRLEDLNFNDIRDFVKAEFLSDPEFRKTQLRLPEFANRLLTDIVVKASGVFLWVDLVVKSLLAGMRLGDRVQDLQRRLDDLPSDLNNLYVKILHSLDPFYLQHAAQYFSLVETAKMPLTLLQFALADDESPESAFELSDDELKPEKIFLRAEAANRRLNNRCKGFLETDRGIHPLTYNSRAALPTLKVQYFHRTARDFIQSTKAQDFLQVCLKPEWDPALQLSTAYMIDCRLASAQDWTLSQKNSGDECLKMAKEISKAHESTALELLDMLKGYRAGSEPLLVTAVKYNLLFYVQARSPRGGMFYQEYNKIVDVDEWSLLQHAFTGRSFPTVEMVNCLMGQGADPNFTSPSHQLSAWLAALQRDYRTGSLGSKAYLDAQENYKQVLKSMSCGRLWYLKFSSTDLTNLNTEILKDILREEERESKLILLSKSWFKARKLERMLLHASRDTGSVLQISR